MPGPACAPGPLPAIVGRIGAALGPREAAAGGAGGRALAALVGGVRNPGGGGAWRGGTEMPAGGVAGRREGAAGIGASSDRAAAPTDCCGAPGAVAALAAPCDEADAAAADGWLVCAPGAGVAGDGAEPAGGDACAAAGASLADGARLAEGA